MMPQAQDRTCPETTGLGRFRHSAAAMCRAKVTVLVIQMLSAERVSQHDDLIVARLHGLWNRRGSCDLAHHASSGLLIGANRGGVTLVQRHLPNLGVSGPQATVLREWLRLPALTLPEHATSMVGTTQDPETGHAG